MMVIIIEGNVADGFTPIGPFPDHEHARQWAETHGTDDAWVIMELENPEETIDQRLPE